VWRTLLNVHRRDYSRPTPPARLGARHGQLSASGLQAYTNIAFFDGHVALFETRSLTIAAPGAPDYYLPVSPPKGGSPNVFLNWE
jgi:prepilin-type processing-associated H-X9-DG protein